MRRFLLSLGAWQVIAVALGALQSHVWQVAGQHLFQDQLGADHAGSSLGLEVLPVCHGLANFDTTGPGCGASSGSG